eukprot:953621-Prorocentrum_minimum.AAC.1
MSEATLPLPPPLRTPSTPHVPKSARPHFASAHIHSSCASSDTAKSSPPHRTGGSITAAKRRTRGATLGTSLRLRLRLFLCLRLILLPLLLGDGQGHLHGLVGHGQRHDDKRLAPPLPLPLALATCTARRHP